MNEESGAPENILDRLNIVIGHTVAWLTLVMVIVSFVIVIIRYVFDSGFIWLQESLTWMHATVFMSGAAYTLQRDEHVRVDIFYRNMQPAKRAWVDLLGVLFFLLPLCGFFAVEAYDYVLASWRIEEVSRNSGGLPYPFIPVLKSLLIVMPVLLSLQGLSIATRALKVLRSR